MALLLLLQEDSSCGGDFQTRLKLLLTCLPCQQKGRAAVENRDLAKSWMNDQQPEVHLPTGQESCWSLWSSLALLQPCYHTGVDIPFLWAWLFSSALALNGGSRAQGLQQAPVCPSPLIYVDVPLHRKTKHLMQPRWLWDIHCHLCEREPRKMGKRALLGPLSSSLSTHWKFATANREEW